MMIVNVIFILGDEQLHSATGVVKVIPPLTGIKLTQWV